MFLWERYFQIDDAFGERISKFPSFLFLDDRYPWDLSEIYDAPVLYFYKGNLDPLKFPKVAVVGKSCCSKTGVKSVEKSFRAWKMNWLSSVDLPAALTISSYSSSSEWRKTIAVIGTGLRCVLS